MGEYMQVRALLQEGEAYAGLILGKEEDPDYHLVLLPGEAVDVSWPSAVDWAVARGVVTASAYEKQAAHQAYRVHPGMLANKGVPQRYRRVKYASAFFRISSSNARRRFSLRSRVSSSSSAAGGRPGGRNAKSGQNKSTRLAQ